MTSGPPGVADAIADFNEGSLVGSVLMRALIAHRPWQLPAILDDDGSARIRLVQVDDDVFLDVFTDEAALKAYRDDGMADDHTTVYQTSFAPILESLEAPVTHLRVNPSSPDALLYDAEQFPLFAELSAAVAVELALAGDSDGPDWLDTVRSYAGFWVAARQDEGARHTMLLPDDDGHMLLAVFTAQDCLDVFLLDHDDLLDETPELIRIDGQELFDLLRTLPAEGIVFNPSGPVEPRAFNLDPGERAEPQVGEA